MCECYLVRSNASPTLRFAPGIIFPIQMLLHVGKENGAAEEGPDTHGSGLHRTAVLGGRGGAL